MKMKCASTDGKGILVLSFVMKSVKMESIYP